MFGKAIVVATAFALAAGSAEAAVVYSQPSNNFGGYASQNDTSTGGLGNFATTYDNFTLGSSTALQSVDFTGSYYNPPTQGLITALTISIYGDLGVKLTWCLTLLNHSAGQRGRRLLSAPTLLVTLYFLMRKTFHFRRAAGPSIGCRLYRILGFPLSGLGRTALLETASVISCFLGLWVRSQVTPPLR